MIAHQIDWTTANRAQLGAAYEFLIGYNPFTDDPTNADDDIRAVLIEYAADYATPDELAELPNILRAHATSLAYFVQRNDCAWCGYWRRVPMQTAANLAELRNRLTARGYIVREIPA